MPQPFALHHGDCLDILKTLADNSVDSIVTDPPYGLGKEPDALAMLTDWMQGRDYVPKGKGGFMGAEWDAFVPQPAVWRECLRVLKPGGHIVAFAGTRTQHLMALGLQIAGFELRDMLAWIYGCLSEDTEVLTEQGFMTIDRIHKAKTLRIFAYNSSTDTYALEQPSKWSKYSVKDTCYRIQSDYTDQLVSRNHRCLVEREGALVFELAENLAQERQARVPVLESLPTMLRAVHGKDEGAGDPQPDVWAGVCQCNHRREEHRPEAGAEESGRSAVRGLRQDGQQAAGVDEADNDNNVQQTVQRGVARCGVGASRSQGAGRVERGIGSGSERTNDRADQSGVEGRRDLPQQKGLLCSGPAEILALSGGVPADGSQGRVHCGVPACDGAALAAQPDASGNGASHRPRPDEQCAGKPDAVCDECRPQEIRGGASYTTTLAAITPVAYEGIIFCPTVSTGAFVARRNGKIFLTGNSGFPKSLDVGKSIDKAAGAEREVVGQADRKASLGSGGRYNTGQDSTAPTISAPATDAAKQWDGWGTALKPALEPITLARKPLCGTVAANVQQHGTGALNIDGCRVGTEVMTESRMTQTSGGVLNANGRDVENGNWKQTPNDNPAQHTGRWPANLLHDGSPDVLAGFPNSNSTKPSRNIEYGQFEQKDTNSIYAAGLNSSTPNRAPIGDTGSAARFFYCGKATKKDRDEGLEGFELGPPPASARSTPAPGRENALGNPRANSHPTVKPTAVMRWLCRLITPPGGVVLDPFTGSGSTLKAAIYEGFQCVGIEREAEYVEIAKARCARAVHDMSCKGKQDSITDLPLFQNQILEMGERDAPELIAQ